ncbi:hypothetical protein M513_09946, partial [Trichuris suis]
CWLEKKLKNTRFLFHISVCLGKPRSRGALLQPTYYWSRLARQSRGWSAPMLSLCRQVTVRFAQVAQSSLMYTVLLLFSSTSPD